MSRSTSGASSLKSAHGDCGSELQLETSKEPPVATNEIVNELTPLLSQAESHHSGISTPSISSNLSSESNVKYTTLRDPTFDLESQSFSKVSAGNASIHSLACHHQTPRPSQTSIPPPVVIPPVTGSFTILDLIIWLQNINFSNSSGPDGRWQSLTISVFIVLAFICNIYFIGSNTKGIMDASTSYHISRFELLDYNNNDFNAGTGLVTFDVKIAGDITVDYSGIDNRCQYLKYSWKFLTNNILKSVSIDINEDINIFSKIENDANYQMIHLGTLSHPTSYIPVALRNNSTSFFKFNGLIKTYPDSDDFFKTLLDLLSHGEDWPTMLIIAELKGKRYLFDWLNMGEYRQIFETRISLRKMLGKELSRDIIDRYHHGKKSSVWINDQELDDDKLYMSPV